MNTKTGTRTQSTKKKNFKTGTEPKRNKLFRF